MKQTKYQNQIIDALHEKGFMTFDEICALISSKFFYKEKQTAAILLKMQRGGLLLEDKGVYSLKPKSAVFQDVLF